MGYLQLFQLHFNYPHELLANPRLMVVYIVKIRGPYYC